jgi:hypothetical protein
MLLDKRPLRVDDVVGAQVGGEIGLDVLEDGNRAVCSATVTQKKSVFNLSRWFLTYPKLLLCSENPIASWKVRRSDS